jgi:hypothetical protein
MRLKHLLISVAASWVLLVLLNSIFPVTALRIVLALLSGGILLAACAWYAMARLAWHAGPADAGRLHKPIAACAVAWAFCLGTALTVAFAKQEESGNPAAVAKPEKPRSELFPGGPRRFLCDLQPFDTLTGPFPIKKADIGGKPIKVGGVLSPNGLSMHPPAAPGYASAKYRLGGEAELFKATVAINDSTDWCWSPATFTVWGDGKELWRSKEIAHNHARSQECHVLIKGVEILELRVQVPNLNTGVHAVWVEPRVLQTADAPDK